MDLANFFASITPGDLAAVRQALDADPCLIDVRHPNKDAWDERSALHCAAKYGHLDIVKLLVERGAEVYSNAMCTYPPVIVAAWKN